MKKEIETKVYVLKRFVTKEYLERKKIKPFGFGNHEEDIRQNMNLTSMQRENVWHPYYEARLEGEEDLKEKMLRKQKEKVVHAPMTQDIEEMETKIKNLDDKEKSE